MYILFHQNAKWHNKIPPLSRKFAYKHCLNQACREIGKVLEAGQTHMDNPVSVPYGQQGRRYRLENPA
jgi:hypothetical protein